MSIASRVSLVDCINIGKRSVDRLSEYVVINKDLSPVAGIELADAGGFLELVVDDMYKCKRIVANNLNLFIVGDYPGIMK